MSIKRFDGNTSLRDEDLTLLVGTMVRRTLRQGVVTVGTTPTEIPSAPLSQRLSITIMNVSGSIVYIGNSSVTVNDGFPLYPRATMRIDIEDSIDIYGIADANSELRILEGG